MHIYLYIICFFLGGCKHAIAFLMWCNRRFESPSPTEVECYWKKSVLSAVGNTNKFITTKILSKYMNWQIQTVILV